MHTNASQTFERPARQRRGLKLRKSDAKRKAPAAERNRGWVNAAGLTPAGTVTYPRKVESRLARPARLPNRGIKSRPRLWGVFPPNFAARLITGRRFFATLLAAVSTAFGHAEVHRDARDLS